MKIRILFSRPNHFTIANYIIEKVEKTNYGHVLFEFEDERTKQIMIYEESHGEAHYMLKTNWLENNHVIESYEAEIMPESFTGALTIMNTSCQASYAYFGILGIALSLLFSIPYNIFANGKRSMVCSEFVGVVLQEIFGYSFNKNFELLSPKDINNKIKGKKSFIRIK